MRLLVGCMSQKLPSKRKTGEILIFLVLKKISECLQSFVETQKEVEHWKPYNPQDVIGRKLMSTHDHLKPSL